MIETEVIGTSDALEAINRAEVDIQIQTARKFPRSMKRAREKILEIATLDPKTAEACFYALPRDGKVIEGPSVRMAEIIAASYGNLRAAARVIGYDETSVICQGVCHDLENNVATSVEVRRRITTKSGRRYSDDMVNTTSNAGCAIAFRNAIFKVVPSAIFKDVVEQVKKVGMGDERTIAEKRKAALAWFDARGYKQKQLFAMLNSLEDNPSEVKAAEELTIDHLIILRGVVNAVNEETTTLEEVFGNVPAGPTDKQKDLKGKLDKVRKETKAAETPETAILREDDDSDSPEDVEDEMSPLDAQNDGQTDMFESQINNKCAICGLTGDCKYGKDENLCQECAVERRRREKKDK